MPDGFERMVDEARTFFAELSDNNTKDWFAPQKARYTEEIKKPAELFADLLAEDISRITGHSVTPKLFRIYRDVRFSKDKTPLNTHLHILWRPAGDHALSPNWFFGLSGDYFLLGVGIMGLQGDGLTQYRVAVDRHGDALRAAMDKASLDAGAELSNWGPDPLKRVPKPYDADHPHADLLKRKGFAFTAPIPDTWRQTGLVNATCARVEALMPIYNLWMATA